MKADAFKTWLGERYRPGVVNARFSNVQRVASFYDVDAGFEEDGLATLISAFDYSVGDATAGRPNPTPIAIDGDLRTGLATLKGALRLYRDFRAVEMTTISNVAIELAAAGIADRRSGRLFEIEAHLQAALRTEAGQLEKGLSIIDGGVERSVESGFIDILAEDAQGALVVIELKRDLARRDAIGQIMGYMGDLMEEEPRRTVRGILVAGDFDRSCIGAARAMPGLRLVRYRFDFQFEDVVSPLARLSVIGED